MTNERGIYAVMAVAAAGAVGLLVGWYGLADTPVMTQAEKVGMRETAVGQPKIEVASSVVDFGETYPVPKLTGTFVVKNVGKGTLLLEDPRAHCGCTVSQVTSKELRTGESAEITFHFSPPPDRQGEVTTTIDLLSNDPVTPKVALVAKARLKPFVEAKPMEFNLGNFYYGDTTNLSAVVRRIDGQPLVITNVVSTARAEITVPDRESTTGSEVPVQIRLVPQSQPTWLSESLLLYSDDAQVAQPVTVFYVYGRLCDRIFATPEQLVWTVPPLADWSRLPNLQERGLRVEALDPSRKVVVKEVRCDVPHMVTEVRPGETASAVTIVLRLVEAPEKPTDGMLTVVLDDDVVPQIEVPIKIYRPTGQLMKGD